ncbi:hypothetical protein BDY17DRAFT_46425 [Neohortaea acidophila]|uniref:Uncharacterized protein n=1 Tax=Neohortaea acidophila TaxID=245834 RepID=A0A6A6PH71_9PEZI|nr:uncharacterized protein BDY17DRAFT_46425 [Neohortaea acidophila]KAF2478953.1 hypothetical protein BDY17DRAFT_46425 [Neohortaea acidophila]
MIGLRKRCRRNICLAQGPPAARCSRSLLTPTRSDSTLKVILQCPGKCSVCVSDAKCTNTTNGRRGRRREGCRWSSDKPKDKRGRRRGRKDRRRCGRKGRRTGAVVGREACGVEVADGVEEAVAVEGGEAEAAVGLAAKRRGIQWEEIKPTNTMTGSPHTSTDSPTMKGSPTTRGNSTPNSSNTATRLKASRDKSGQCCDVF